MDICEVGQRPGEVGAITLGHRGGQLPVYSYGLLGDRQRLGRAVQRRELDAEVGQRDREVGAVAVGHRGGQLPVYSYGLLLDLEGLARAQARLPDDGCHLAANLLETTKQLRDMVQVV